LNTNCLSCGAFDWRELTAGSLCEVCFIFVPKITPPCDVDDLPDEFAGGRENPWCD
jgi:hypothetical protein